jgi:aryl-alcohol dehydrogenase-like predicted oxidoreductase
VRRAVEDSLRRLGTDRIDLYQLHRPDPSVPIADTLGVLDEVVGAGKVREMGCSNFSVAQLREAERAAKPGAARFVSVQNRYSLFFREPEEGVLAECERQGIAFLPYYPLEAGVLTGKVRPGGHAPEGSRLGEARNAERFLSDAKLRVVESLRAFAESRGHTILELAISWLLAHRVVASVIAGATKPEQVRANAAAAGWALTSEEMAQVEALMA